MMPVTGPRVRAGVATRFRARSTRPTWRLSVPVTQQVSAAPRDGLFRNAYALIINTGLSGALGVLFWSLAAHLYAPGVVGRNTALISAMMTLSTVAQLDMASALMRFLPVMRRMAAKAVAGAYAVAVLVSALLAVGFFDLASRLSSNLSFIHGSALGIVFTAGLVLWSVFAIQDGVLTGLQRTPVVPIENAGYNLVKTALLVLVAGALPAWGIFASWTLPLLAAIAAVNLLIFRRYLPSHSTRSPSPIAMTRRTALRYLGFDYVGGLCGAAQTIAMPLVVTVTLGATANAHFYVAWMLVTLLDTVSLSLGKSLLVEGSYQPDELVAFGRRAIKGMLLMLVPAVAATVAFSPLATYVFGSHYDESPRLLRILVLGLIPRALFSLTASVARVRGEVGRILTYTLMGMVAIGGLSVAGAEYFGTTEALCVGWTLGNTAIGLLALPWLRTLLTRSGRRTNQPASFELRI